MELPKYTPMNMYRAMTAMAIPTLAVALTGCSPYILKPGDKTSASPNAGVTISSPTRLIEKDEAIENVKLIFIHGMGDHESGYAIDPTQNESWARRIVVMKMFDNVVWQPHPQQITIPAKTFNPEATEPKSDVVITKSSFLYHRTGNKLPDVRVDAIEVNWSHLTQWVKRKYLGYDISHYCAPAEVPNRSCINKSIKEDIIDSSLSDAVLYIGKYGELIRAGVQEALCRGLSNINESVVNPCKWNGAAQSNTRYIFITHSLGSRILFDIFREQLVSTVEANKTQYQAMLNYTETVYMMANQIPLIGLARLEIKETEEENKRPLGTNVSIKDEFSLNTSNNQDSDATGLGVLAQRSKDRPSMQLVAFSDTNDLLSWGIPNWYENDKKLHAEITNVFVNNSVRILWLLGIPTSAHTDYFDNEYVARIVRCGVTNGRINDCLPSVD